MKEYHIHHTYGYPSKWLRVFLIVLMIVVVVLCAIGITDSIGITDFFGFNK